MSKEITDQQKIKAVNDFLRYYGTEETVKLFKNLLFRAQTVFMKDDIDPQDSAIVALELLYNFFDDLEPKEKTE